MTPYQLDLIQQWHAAQAQLRQLEVRERELRSAVVQAMFGDYGEGSKTVDIGNGYTLKNVNSTRWDVQDTPELRLLEHNFKQYGETAEAGKALIVNKPRLSVRAFKALPQWGRAMMTPHITATPQLPQLSIINPKA